MRFARVVGTDNTVPVAWATESEPTGDELVVGPGWIDLQVNGLGGRAFNDEALTVDEVHHISRRLWKAGVAQYCPTVITDDIDRLERVLSVIAQAATDDVPEARAIVGIHLEGPFISPEDGPRGAHPRDHVRPAEIPVFERLQRAAKGLIVIVTLAPEVAGGLELIRYLRAQGVVPAIGHTAAPPEVIHQAADDGALLATHVGNGCHELIHRHRNPLFAQLADERLMASFIADGHHLPPDTLRVFLVSKGHRRAILVSDVMHWAGMAPGRYRWGHLEVEVTEDGRAQIVGQPRLAGAAALLDVGYRNVQQWLGWSEACAWDLVAKNPRALLSHSPSARERLLPSWTLLDGARPVGAWLADEQA